jgi:hypothetical protein
MSLSKLVELVGKAEEEGVTLAAMISTNLSPEELERARLELSMEISKSYSAIEDYMSDVEVPSLDDIVATGFPGFPSLLESDELPRSKETLAEIQ